MRVRCLGDELTEYAAGRLPLDRQWAWDRHLVACRVCCQAVEEERRLRAALAGSPSMPGDLRSSLLALGSSMAAEAPARPAADRHPDPLRLLAPSAPACHRSPLRATVVAAAAAGVSAAAAWSLTVVPAPGGARPALATTATPVASPAAAPSRTTSTTPAVSPVGLSQTVVLTRLGQQAQSTP
ncbi:hypothetical protein GCM10023168_33350 [Fodinibacter luteus]|uniref:Zinc-finger domain-containing protein n=2 Tax=Fodinibacter luteus TaxID=552064 RepID=A0ABP8KPM7_9MICO